MCNYTYKCKVCGEHTVHNVPMKDRDNRPDLECEVCSNTNLVRIRDNPSNRIVGGRNKGRNNSADIT